MKYKTCGHGVSFRHRCVDCELVSKREALAYAQRRVLECEAAVIQLAHERNWGQRE